MRFFTLLTVTAASLSGTCFGDNVSQGALSKIQGKWRTGCVWQVESGWGSPQVFGLVTTVTVSGDRLERKMEFHADEESCEDRAKAILTITTKVDQISGKLGDARGARLDEELVSAKLSVPTEYGAHLFGQFVGTLAMPGHCLEDVQSGKVYDVRQCHLGAIGQIPAVGASVYDRIRQSGSSVWFPARERRVPNGEQTFRVLTGINKYQGVVDESRRASGVDEEQAFAKLP